MLKFADFPYLTTFHAVMSCRHILFDTLVGIKIDKAEKIQLKHISFNNVSLLHIKVLLRLVLIIRWTLSVSLLQTYFWSLWQRLGSGIKCFVARSFGTRQFVLYAKFQHSIPKAFLAGAFYAMKFHIITLMRLLITTS